MYVKFVFIHFQNKKYIYAKYTTLYQYSIVHNQFITWTINLVVKTISTSCPAKSVLRDHLLRT